MLPSGSRAVYERDRQRGNLLRGLGLRGETDLDRVVLAGSNRRQLLPLPSGTEAQPKGARTADLLKAPRPVQSFQLRWLNQQGVYRNARLVDALTKGSVDLGVRVATDVGRRGI